MKSSISIIVAAALFSVAATISCNKKSVPAPEVSFGKDIIPVLKANCAINSSCHSSPNNTGDNLDFDSSNAYNTIIGKSLVNTQNPSSSLLYVEVSSGTMPKAPYSHLSGTTINLILNWIKQGAGNN